MRQHDCNLQRCGQDRKKTNQIKREKIMSMFNDAVLEDFVIYNAEGEQVASGVEQALELVGDIDNDYLVRGDESEFEITSGNDGVVANDMHSLLELLNEHGFKVVWADDQIDHDDIDDEMSIKDYLTDLGIKTNN